MNSFNPTRAVDTALTEALKAARSSGATELTSAHLLAALLSQADGGAPGLLRVLGADPEKVRSAALAIAAQVRKAADPSVVPRLNEAALSACTEARRLADERGEAAVSPRHLLIGLAWGSTAEARLLAENGASYHLLRAVLAAGAAAEPEPHAHSDIDTRPLAKYSTDLTELAILDELDPVVGRHTELLELAKVWARRSGNAAVLLGDPDVGKTAIVSGLAQRIAADEAPDLLRDHGVVRVDVRAMITATRSRSAFDELLTTVLDDVEDRAGRAVVFIDDLAAVATAAAEFTPTVSDILAPAYSRPALRLVAAASRAHYTGLTAADDALTRIFVPVEITSLSTQDAVEALAALAPTYAAYHGVEIPETTATAAVELSDHYLAGPRPHSALQLLDATAARLRIDGTDRPLNCEDLAVTARHLANQRPAPSRSQSRAASHRAGPPSVPPAAAPIAHREEPPEPRSREEMAALAASLLERGDETGARYWYLKAADAGDPHAMYTLARMIQDGVARQGVLQRWQRRHRNGGDLIDAQIWLRKAAVAGHSGAMSALAALLRADGQINEAQVWEHRVSAGPGARPVSPRAAAPAAQAPVTAPGPAPANEFRLLLTMVLGSHATAERLIAFEQRQLPGADRATWIAHAIDRLRNDSRG
ncbi:Clp protease N-terminal domain-containing protein [Nocardia carnea]|uniref:Clp protease N-terminal domain-containing protein n=1 Tax=Nocardia carnea TaxID=37328 RepID=UPI0024575249|nr:Clp protease N-terminal domain-containing protein [Nocardia carnea]